MGYYVNSPMITSSFDKAERIVELFGGEIVGRPIDFGSIPNDKALIIVVENPGFEAAALAYDENEFKVFTDPRDNRPKTYIFMDKSLAYNIAGYTLS